jgi:uncharacterized membrane protein YvlD (DUF360 family)
MYCTIFIAITSRKKISPADIFIVSVFIDIYSCAFVGITFISATIFFIITRKFRALLQNFYINVWYLFISLCCCKFIIFLLISLMKYSFDIRSNFVQILWTSAIYAFCCCAVGLCEKSVGKTFQ